MSSPDLTAIRVAAAAVLATIPGLNAHATYPGVLNSPAAVVIRRETTYAPAFDVLADHTLAIRVFVSFAALEQSQQRLDGFCAPAGATSIPAAFDANPTLGGLVDWTRIATAEDERVTPYGGNDYLTVDLILEVG